MGRGKWRERKIKPRTLDSRDGTTSEARLRVSVLTPDRVRDCCLRVLGGEPHGWVGDGCVHREASTQPRPVLES